MLCSMHMAQGLVGAGAFVSFGALGSLHCAGMCGPLACLAAGEHRQALALYHGARLFAYAAAGALIAIAGIPLRQALAGPWVPLLLALPLLLFALRPTEPPLWLATVHAKGARLARAWPPTMRALALGALTPLLPCGLFWAAAGASALAPSPLIAAGWMAAFAAGTLPGLLLTQSTWLTLGRSRRWAPSLQRLSALIAASTLLWMNYVSSH